MLSLHLPRGPDRTGAPALGFPAPEVWAAAGRREMQFHC